jgi:integrase
MKAVQDRLGHASIALTADTYTHVMPEVRAEAAELVAKLFNAATPSLANG